MSAETHQAGAASKYDRLIAAAKAVRTCAVPMPYAVSSMGFSSARTAGLAPPLTITCPTPSTCESFCATIESAESYICESW